MGADGCQRLPCVRPPQDQIASDHAIMRIQQGMHDAWNARIISAAGSSSLRGGFVASTPIIRKNWARTEYQ